MDMLSDMTMEQILERADIIMANLHFVRADWFYAFIPLILFLLLSYWKKQDDKNWLPIIDKALLPFVLTKSSGKRRRYPLFLVFIAASLCITALAGPVYKKLPQPVFREQSSLVVLLDLSQSMNATDIKPSRLIRAKLELLDILKLRKTGQTALVVYAADAFVVTPLTDDNATIANLVPALTTEMMPAQGSNLSIALAKTSELFNQAGINKGDILLITDDIHSREQASIEKIVSQGHRLSIFGIGTADGAPIPLDESMGGGFLLDRDGAIVIPRVDSSKLQRYALSGGGLYTVLDAGDSDVNKLARLFESSELAKDDREDSEENANQDLTADLWQEEGHWLLLPLLFFAALWARRGWLAIVILFALPVPPPVYADETKATQASMLDSAHLWSTPDQKAMRAFDAGDNRKAAEQFSDPDWKASALYRDGNYQGAVDALQDTQHSDGFYNKGNALANLGRYDEAIEAYDKALELNPDNADAAHNREQVKQAQKQQKQQQQDSQQDQQQQDQSQQDQQQDQSQDQSQQDQQQDQQSSSESQSDAEQDDQQANNQQAEQNNQQMEDEELKQRDAEAEKQQQQQEQLEYQQQQQDQQQDPQSEESKDQEQAKGDEEEKQQVEHAESDERPQEIEVNPMEASITEEEKATEQWLKRIPDDPGGLLRRKFLYQYNQTQNGNDEQQPW